MVALSLLCFAPLLQRRELNTRVSTRAISPFINKRPLTGFGDRSRFSLAATAASDLLPTIRDGVADAGGEEAWRESVARLSNTVELDEEEAEMFLADALNWRGWAICSEKMRRFMRPALPDAEKLEESLAWLREGPLELDQDQLRAAIRDSPKVYLGDPQGTFNKALKTAPKQYRAPEDFKALVLEDPSVLQCTYNCDEDGCASECGNCWVSYQNR